MSIHSDFQADLTEALFGSDWGRAQTVTYMPEGGSPISISAILVRGDDLEDANWRAALQASATLYVNASDVASPSYQDQVEVDGEAWTVARKTGNTGIWKLEIRRDLRPTFRRG
jgi:hypothetical protein